MTAAEQRIDQSEAAVAEFRAWLAATEARFAGMEARPIEMIAEVRRIRADRSEVTS